MCKQCEETQRVKNEVFSGVGVALGGDYAIKTNSASTQYTPLLVQTMFELHCFPDKRRDLLKYQDRSGPLQEVIHLLERAKILSAGPSGFSVDDDALRAYVNAVCNVSLPTKTWVMR